MVHFCRLKKLANNQDVTATIKDVVDEMDSPTRPSERSPRSSSCRRPLQQPPSPTHPDLDPQPPLVDESNLKAAVRQLNAQMVDQRKAMAKMSKLCFGALSALAQLESRQKSEDIDKSVNQPMERIKRLSEETVKLNAMIQQTNENLHDLEVHSATKHDLNNILKKNDIAHLGMIQSRSIFDPELSADFPACFHRKSFD